MILLRHGQSEFNLHFSQTRKDPGIVDPKLTPLGHTQALAAADALAGEGIARIVVSPLTRAIETAMPLAKRLGLPLLVNPVVRERYAFTCDIGTPAAELSARFPGVSFDTLEEVWWPSEEEPEEAVVDRAALFRAEMAALDGWRDTLVVSHWGFILAMTGQSVMNGQWVRCDPTGPAPERLVWKP